MTAWQTMKETANPYRDALKGLKLDDPVGAFFDWCRERERIRVKRERGLPPPWSADPIFQQGRFLNVFREDDKGSKAILRFVGRAGKTAPELLHALFFARWCNLQSTLDRLDPGLLRQPERLRHFLVHEVDQPWWSEAYPVVDARWEGKTYDRLAGCVELFPRCLDFLEACVRGAAGNVATATRQINARFGMSNDFPIFMAVADVAWFEARADPGGQPGADGHRLGAVHGSASTASRAIEPRGHDAADDRIAANALAGSAPRLHADRCRIPLLRVPQIPQLRQRHQAVRGAEPVCGFRSIFGFVVAAPAGRGVVRSAGPSGTGYNVGRSACMPRRTPGLAGRRRGRTNIQQRDGSLYGPTMAMLSLAGVSAGLKNMFLSWLPLTLNADPPFSTTTTPFFPKGGTSFRTSGPSPLGKLPGS